VGASEVAGGVLVGVKDGVPGGRQVEGERKGGGAASRNVTPRWLYMWRLSRLWVGRASLFMLLFTMLAGCIVNTNLLLSNTIFIMQRDLTFVYWPQNELEVHLCTPRHNRPPTKLPRPCPWPQANLYGRATFEPDSDREP
jgi:hypothetical protein